MKARLRTCLAALACLAAGAPALAQQLPGNTAVPAQNGIVGPTQLQNFSINGTVTKPATPPPAQEPAQQAQPKPRTAPAPASAQTQSQKPPVQQSRTEQPPVMQRGNDSVGRGAEVTAAPPPAVTVPPPTATQNTRAGELPPASATAEPASSNSLVILPWIVAALALAGAAAWFLLRRRPRESLAGTGSIDLFDSPAVPAPAAPIQAPPASPPPQAPALARPEPVATGIVSTRLRPWLEIELHPDRAVIDEEKAAVAFEMSVYNSGNGPARDVVLEATLFNAGPVQDQQIQLFFDNPVGKGDPVAVIPPLKRATVNTVVFIARDKVQPIEVEGRSLFVPIIAVNALYVAGSSKAQTSASFIVGKQTAGEKLAPLRMDLGPRIFRGLAAREHELKVRK